MPKGYKFSDEARRKISLSNKGKHFFKHTKEAKRKIGLASKGNQHAKGNISWNKVPRITKHCLMCGQSFGVTGYRNNKAKYCSMFCLGKSKLGRSPWNKGKKYLAITGEKHFAWKGGITSKNHKIRTSLEYKLWRKSVFERDNYACIWCGNNKSGNLNADHIKPFAYYPELRFAIDNGRTLCVLCHKTTESYLRNKKS